VSKRKNVYALLWYSYHSRNSVKGFPKKTISYNIRQLDDERMGIHRWAYTWYLYFLGWSCILINHPTPCISICIILLQVYARASWICTVKLEVLEFHWISFGWSGSRAYWFCLSPVIACSGHLRILYVSDDRKCLFQQMQNFQFTLLCYYLLMLFSTHKTQPLDLLKQLANINRFLPNYYMAYAVIITSYNGRNWKGHEIEASIYGASS
jgi:hypothetical protein